MLVIIAQLNWKFKHFVTKIMKSGKEIYTLSDNLLAIQYYQNKININHND